ncbi:abnormal spindle-like microcephaly-associated protein [Colius striatus]|uniref:abnormal spindle-like microcephaly-associated protein n=1 Tax=Colius striatus TaxID=57412 RepID=UPI002B1DE390|nr:abnormal spindle-like microcephaly-associated protein [Colius striatus]
MAAAFFPGGAAWDPRAAGKPGRRRWARRDGEEEADEEPAVLVLSHFSRPPFLSFGSLRVGAARTRLLGIDNPNEEDVEVIVDRVPAPDRGFSIDHRRFSVQSGQRIFINVTWMPLEEGKVRELITFVINGIVKHQAVLLGVAEQPVKKKKSLWDIIKKKNPSETPASIKVKRSTLKVKNVDKTFQVSQKGNRLRSPLQPCENYNTKQSNLSPGNDSSNGSENKLPISPIAPVLEEPRTPVGTPLAMRRSTMLSDVAAVNEELLPEVGRCNIKKIVNEHKELKSESASGSGVAQLPISNNEVILNCVLSAVCSPEYSASVTGLSTRRILSPDSFVNNSYPGDIDTFQQPVPILSPDQFLKDSLSNNQSMTPKLERALIATTTETYVVKKCPHSKWKKSEDVQQKPHIRIECNSEVHKIESQVLCYNKPNGKPISFPSTGKLQTRNSSQKEQPKKRPILSATVIKKKPDAAEEKRMETLQPKSKKCLNKALTDCDTVVPVHTKAEISRHLPVIGPISAENKCHNEKVNVSPAESTSLCRKRKHEIYVESSRATAPAHVEEVERKRALTSKVDSKTCATMRPSAFKPTNRERVGHRKQSGSLQKASKTTNRISRPVPGLAQSHLTFVKPPKTVIPRHPMPFAAKYMFYDERWKEKQERGFTWWLNFVLTPDDFTVKTNASQVSASALILGGETHHKTSVPKAPTKDEASLKVYTARRKLNKLRHEACRLFNSEAMVKAIKKLEVEIETRRLLVRRDRHLCKDVGERQKILNWLLSYNPLWLRIGLETVYGELIALESNSDVTGLAIFILNRLLWNPDIAAEYRHPTVPHLYREGHEEALSKFTLKKLLLLVCFLDCAKRSRMIHHDPCLFCKDAEFKASKDLLLAFSRDFLSGEGDLSRHLGFLGFPVSHVQTPLDEFDFAVTNLAVDLQCGIRLVRTMELLTKNWSLSKQLRVPAISRLQKMHNVDLVLNVLKEHGILLRDENGTSIDCRDIVDRHREKTLALLWKIVFAFQVDVFLNVEQLKEEIEFLKNTYKRKRRLGALRAFTDFCGAQENNSISNSPQSYSENVNLLMEWVNAVCGFYSIKVENFTACFSDGRVLCHLIHHYHPCYVPLEAVCQHTTQTVECSRTHTVGLNSSSSSSSESDTSLNVMEGMFDPTGTGSALYKELLDNERKNFQLINAAVSDLGGIPAMIYHSDMSNTIPDEKVVITYLSFLCSRLLDLRQETRAARLIQSAWRNYRLKRELKLSQERDRAARIIQRSAVSFLSRRRNLKKANAAILIQKHWRRYLAMMPLLNLKKRKLEEARSKSATVIQAYWRRYSARRRYLQLRYYVIFVQASIRMVKSVAAYRKLKGACIRIQAVVRGYLVRKQVQKWREAAVFLQACYRMRRDRQRYLSICRAAVVVQQRYRAYKKQQCQRQEFLQVKKVAVCLQAAYRGYKARKRLKLEYRAAIKIQTAFRAHAARRKYKAVIQASIVIQQWYRACKTGNRERLNFLTTRAATLSLQAAFRGWKVRKQIRRQRFAATKIQSAFRKFMALKEFRLLKCAVLTVQRHYRASVIGQNQRQEYVQLRNSVVCLQAIWRGRAVRKTIQKKHYHATIIQSYYRMHVNQLKYKKLRQATVVIQKYYRAYCMKKTQRTIYLKTKAAVLVLQSAYRGMTVRKQLNKLNKAATTIQAAFKSYLVKKDYGRLRWAAIVVQRRYRAVIHAKCQKEKYLALKKATVKVQAIYRGVRARRRIHCMHQAALCIQATFKMHHTAIKYQTMRMAAIIIQRQYRAFCLGKVQRKKYLKLKQSVIVLQAAFRGMKVRQDLKTMHQAAAVIQSYYRMYRQQLDFRRLLLATRQIQQWFRACRERNAHVHNYRVVRSAALLIQAAFRGMRARRLIRSMNQSAKLIQRRFRTFLARKHFLSLKTAAIVVQRKYRATKLAKSTRHQYLSIVNAVVTIQSAYRGFVVRKQMRQVHQAATVLQATLQMRKIDISYEAVRLASVTIQQHYRAYREGKCVRERFLKMKFSALTIQRRWRATLTARVIQHHFLSTKNAAVKIQLAYRQYRARRLLRKISEEKQRKRLLYFTAAAYHHISAIKIQRAYRIHLILKLAQKQISSVIIIQRWFRARMQQKTFLRDYRRISQLQRVIRGWLNHRRDAATTIQRAVRRFLACRRRRRFAVGIMKFQALWRGYSWRKRNDTAKTKALRLSLENANKKCREENKLCNRTAIAIENLLKHKQLSYILEALKNLEVATRLSPLCCENMAQSSAIVTIFVLIRSCNRSVPCMDVIRYSIQVLLNVSKYERTSQAVYEAENSIETLLDLLQMYREKVRNKVSEKGGTIFTKTCCLLALLSKDSKRALEIRSIPRAVPCIQSLYKLTTRKHKMDAERTLAKQKTNMFLSGTSFVPVTLPRIKAVSRIKPDWFLRKDNMQEIVDPLQAILMVMDTLGIARC